MDTCSLVGSERPTSFRCAGVVLCVLTILPSGHVPHLSPVQKEGHGGKRITDPGVPFSCRPFQIPVCELHGPLHT